ncbi:MAG: hypothetical protein IJ736_09575 [Firmicutes bacterium]|nr:hypothetical protein [Bacillota bacterium]
MSDKEKINVHKGHRERVRERFIKEGNLDSFQDHELIEFLLFYAIKMRDTNDLAHRMIDRFGSLHELFNASPKELTEKCGVSENTAVLISIIPHLCRRYLRSSWDRDNFKIESSKAASKYFDALLAGLDYETFYMVGLDVRKRIKCTVKISQGNITGAKVYVDKVMSEALLHKVKFVIIGHNHPGLTRSPSEADIDSTRKIKIALDAVGIKLVDHIIVCGEDNYSFAENKIL